MGKRREPRIRFAAPIKGWSADQHGTAILFCACVLDGGWRGVRLYTYALTLPGEIVTLGYGHRKATFRVVWVAQRGSRRQGQVGLENLEPSKPLFRHLCPVQNFEDRYPQRSAASAWKTRNTADMGTLDPAAADSTEGNLLLASRPSRQQCR